MSLRNPIHKVTERIRERSKPTRDAYLRRLKDARDQGPARGGLACGNLAHAMAALELPDKEAMAAGRALNLGIITAYNDMLSAHRPYETYPEMIRAAARETGGTAQVAGGVPAMCDGVTQGQTGMEMSLFSRDVIALAAGVALSHNTFDAAVFLGICDKIVPGLVIAAATFGHLPAVFIPAGPMTSGISNDEKAKVRERFAKGEIDRDALLRSEMAAYHGPGTCTFYGTANSNQMLMEFMGLHLPGASFINPGTPLRDELTKAAARRALAITAEGNDYIPAGKVLDERAFVNGMVGLHATGGSTNLVMHMTAMARAAGIILSTEDFSEISDATPLLARVYPNGKADVNHFHAAGGLGYLIGELLDEGLLHDDSLTVAGTGLAHYTKEPVLDAEGNLAWRDGAGKSHSADILRPVSDPFQANGGLKRLSGNLGSAVMKISAVPAERHRVSAPARIFHDQEAVKAAFEAGEFTGDVIIVVRFQGPRANGMPELHALTPLLGILQDRGQQVALVTDGRMSGASGKIPAAIHLSPEALDGGPIARIQDGDRITVDAVTGVISVDIDEADFAARPVASADLSGNEFGTGRELFRLFRQAVGSAETGASPLV